VSFPSTQQLTQRGMHEHANQIYSDRQCGKGADVMKQRDIFLGTEGDAWCLRNKEALSICDYGTSDAVASSVREILELAPISSDREFRVLEIGCGDGSRLSWLSANFHVDVYGIEPSALGPLPPMIEA